MKSKENLSVDKYCNNKMDILNTKYKLMLLKKKKQNCVNNYNEIKKLSGFFHYIKLMENLKKEELNKEINRIRYYIKLRKIFRYTLLLSVILFFYYKYSNIFNNYFVTIKYTLKQWFIAYQIYSRKIKLCSIS